MIVEELPNALEREMVATGGHEPDGASGRVLLEKAGQFKHRRDPARRFCPRRERWNDGHGVVIPLDHDHLMLQFRVRTLDLAKDVAALPSFPGHIALERVLGWVVACDHGRR